MPIWAIIMLVVYVVVGIAFIIAIYTEAPKHRAEVGLGHFLVAVAWPAWAVWYLWVIVRDYFKEG